VSCGVCVTLKESRLVSWAGGLRDQSHLLKIMTQDPLRVIGHSHLIISWRYVVRILIASFMTCTLRLNYKTNYHYDDDYVLIKVDVHCNGHGNIEQPL
jgi:hypothetical protein